MYKRFTIWLTVTTLTLTVIFTASCKKDKDAVSYSLVTSHRTSGKFYTINPSNGNTTEIFTPTFSGSTLNDIRAFVYHPKQNLFYASVSSSVGADLYTINPANKVATKINDNDGTNGPTYTAVVNWAVAADDSLIAVGDFDDDDNGIEKFGINGGRSAGIAEADVCCGLGMLYDASTSTFKVANGWSTDEMEVLIQTITATGTVTGSVNITTFNNFPDDLSDDWVVMKGMAQNTDGNIYGVLYNSDRSKTYFVRINMTAPSIDYISTLGADNANQYNNLTLIPNSTFQ